MANHLAGRLLAPCCCTANRQWSFARPVLTRPAARSLSNNSTSPRRHGCLQRPTQRISVISRAQDAGQEFIEDRPFRIEQVAFGIDQTAFEGVYAQQMLTKTSFGSILTPIGIGLLVYGFGAFFRLLPGGDLSSLMLIYGFPILLLGFALSYAQLQPVPCKTTKAAFDVREGQQTDIQKQVREDVTRFRYGDEQHLDEALTRVFNFNRPSGIARRLCPVLVGVREEATDGRYTLVMQFEIKKDMRFDMWETRQDKFKTFFGPGIDVNLAQTEGGVEVALIADGSGSGRGGTQQRDVLPPLVPGAKARNQK